MEDEFALYINHGLLSQNAIGRTAVERFIGHFGTVSRIPLESACRIGPKSVNSSKLKMRWYSAFNNSILRLSFKLGGEFINAFRLGR